MRRRKLIRTTFFDRLFLFVNGMGVAGMMYAAIHNGEWFNLWIPIAITIFSLGDGFGRVCNGHVQTDDFHNEFFEGDVKRLHTDNGVATLLNRMFGLYLGYYMEDIPLAGSRHRLALFWPDGQICRSTSAPFAPPFQRTDGSSHLKEGTVGIPFDPKTRGDEGDGFVEALVDSMKNGVSICDECGTQSLELPPFSTASELKMKLQLSGRGLRRRAGR